MSKIKIQGNASGTGVVTLTAPATSTDKTITLPDTTATLVGSDTAVVKDASGNVGIGVTPESWSSSYSVLQLGAKGASLIGHDTVGYLGLSNNANYVSGASWTRINAQAVSRYELINDGTHSFSVAPSGTADSAISWTTAMTIDNGGNVLVGTSSLAAIDNTPSDIGVGLRGGGSIVHSVTGGGNAVEFKINGTGGVGAINCSGSSTSYGTSSDYRLKENVVPMSGSIDRLKELKPSRFNFIADADKTVDGFLAHEAQSIVPECVTGEKDAMMMEEYEVTPAVMDGETVVTEAVMGEREVPDMQGIDQSKLVPLLVGAIQELTARLESLEAN